MNKFVEFTVYGLQFKGNRSSGRRRAERGVASGTASGSLNRVVRCLILAVLLLGTVLPAMARDYVISYTNGGTTYYIGMEGNNIAVKTTVDPSCIWTCHDGGQERNLGGTSYGLRNKINTGYWLTTNCTRTNTGSWLNPSYSYSWSALTVQNNASNIWRSSSGTNGNVYAYASGTGWNRNASIGNGGNALTMTDNNNSGSQNYRVTDYSTTVVSDNLTTPTISISENGTNTISFSHTDISGTYRPEYTQYTFNNNTHYWYNDDDHNSAPSTVNVNTMSPNYTWSLTANGGDVATINSSTGVLTLDGAPTGNITVRLTVSNTTPAFTKTVDFPLTRTHYSEDVSTTATMSAITLTPTSRTMEYGDAQGFTASATVNTTTTTTQAYDRLQGGGNTYYYYDGALHNSTPTPEVEVTHPEPTYSWTLTGAGATYLSLSTTSGSSTTVTHSNSTQSNSNATLTVTASTPGASNRTNTATITVVPTTATAIAAGDLTVYMGNSGVVNYSLTPSYAYDRVNATSGSTGVFTVNASPVSGGSVNIAPVAPGQTTLTLVAQNPDGTNGTTTTATVTVRGIVANPEISIGLDGSTVKATLTCATAGATIKYTTDGSDPSTSGTALTYGGTPITVADGTTVKAYATGSNAYWEASEIVTKTCNPLDYIESGVSGGTVTLNDLEDHNWTYYSGVDASVDGGDYNTNYLGKLYSPNPRNVKITYNGVNGITGSNTAVKVSVDAGETQNQFVYYKTLEEGTTSGEYPYQVISNPFSVRPSTGTGNSKVYYGFAGWKIVSGGDYIKNHSNNDVLALDEEIVFENLPYTSVNCTSAEIVFQTTWTTANVQTGNNITTMLSSFSGGTYETNFAVLTGQYTTAWTGNKNATITSVMPDGSSDYRGVVTRLNVTVNAGYTIKYEYININNNNSTFTMGTGTKTLYIGRGVSNTTAGSSCCNLIQGCNGNITEGLTYTLKIESGVYGNISYTRGLNTSQTASISGTVNIKSTLGCDYDRANNNNNNLKFTNEMWFGDGPTLSTPTSGTTIFTCIVKSGTMNSSLTSAGTGDAQNSFYVGIGANYSPGHRRIEVEGGEFWSLAGGLDDNNPTDPCITYRIRGGLFKGAIYGSAANATANGIKQMIFTGGTIQGWIGAGANGTANNGGKTNGISYVYIGGKTQVVGNNDTYINGSVGGNVFGAGSGSASYTAGEMTEGSNVVVADQAYVVNNVYGGGNFGFTDKTANVYITGGVIDGKVFGGANQNKGDYTNIVMTGGVVKGGVYGGCNTSGTIGYNVTMHINGGQVGTPSSPANIHGGGYGQPTRVSRNVDITLGNSCTATEGVTVYGDVYGGSALGYVNGTTATNEYHTYVTLNKGTIYGSLYGGGLGNAGNAANVYGPVQVKVYGGSVKKTDANGANGSGGVYGCNNVNGAPQRAVSVDIYGTDPAPSENEYALFAVYGGGNQANYSYGTPTVKVHNCNNSIEYVYGGGNAAHITNGNTDVTIYGGNKIGNVFGGGNGTVTAANVSGDTDVKIYGGTIGKVFGGSNSRGSIGGTINVTAETQTESGTDPCSENAYQRCPIQVGELYGGGNQAASDVGTIDIGCMNAGDMIDYVYGGSNDADITGNVALTMTGGRVGNLFGGNNTGHSIDGAITVNVEWDGSCSNNYLGNVYGGGNLASYSGSPAVNIKNGTVSNNVYGGGKGQSAVVTGSPAVTIGDANDLHSAIVGGDVYGGGDAAAVMGATSVVYNDANATSSVGRLFGGGNAAGVSSTATVTLTNGKVTGGIYGGCNATGSVGAVTVALNGGTVGATGDGNKADVYGGGFGAATTTTGNIGVTLNGATVYGDLYGGSALGSVNALTSNTTTVTLTTATLHGSIFGGGKGDNASLGDGHSDVTATSEGKAIVNINVYDQYLTGIYGGANVRGLVKGDITVNVNANVGADGNSLDIFGGGYGANTATNGNVTVNVGAADGSIVPTIYGDIYGGSALGSVNDAVGDFTTVNINNGTIHGDVYGGGLGAATVLPNGYLDPEAPKVEAIEYGTVHVNIGTSEQLSNSVVIDGKVFGCNNRAGTPKGHVYVDVYHTAHTDANRYPSPEPATVAAIADQTAYAISEVYGGGNLAHYSTTEEGASTHVHVHNCDNTIQYVYGGGNAANTQANAVRVDGGRMLYVFGGGNGAGTGNPGANVAGNASVTLGGGIIDYVFGGSNTLGMVNGTTSITFTSPATCTRLIKELYGGGNLAPGGAVNMTLPCGTTGPDIVFGGSKNADIGTEDNHKNINLTIAGGDYSQVFGGNNQGGIIWGNVTLTLVGGTIRDAFGGNNQGGNIKGTITVNVEDAENVNCPLEVDNVYGGGNQAAYTPSSATITSPKVNILHGTVNNAVFGGGLGAAAGVTANPQVTIGDAEDGSHSATVGATKIGGGAGDGYVFGGGSEAVVHKSGANSGNTHVILTGNAHVTGNVYGGGNQADVEGNSHVEMR